MFNSRRGKSGLILLAVGMMGFAQAGADPTVTYNKWLEDIKFSGDLRIREEIFDKRTPNQVDRKRARFRLRLNTDAKLPYRFNVKFTFASGTGEQTSTNQSFDNLSSQKQLWIDKAFLVWNPWEPIKLQLGKMENPFWRPYTSDIIWDDDFNPEGFSESYQQLLGPVNIFINALQMIVDEDSGNNVGTAAAGQQADQWLIAEQIGLEFRLPLESRAKVAYSYYDWQNERNGDFGQGSTFPTIPSTALEGNRRTGNTLLNNFNVHEFTAQLNTWIARLPISLQGTMIRNTGVLESTNPKEDRGYQAGGLIGQAKEKNTFEIAYFRKYSETDATVADISDSDFGDGGTNRKGGIFWLAYAPQEWMLLKFKYFDTKVINETLAPTADDIRRAQFDWSVKF